MRLTPRENAFTPVSMNHLVYNAQLAPGSLQPNQTSLRVGWLVVADSKREKNSLPDVIDLNTMI